MKTWYILLLLLLAGAGISSYAQSVALPPTRSFKITGKVKQEVIVNDTDLKQYTIHGIGDVTISNHLGEKKKVVHHLSGVLLKDILQNVVLTDDNPKVYSEYYLVCEATDGYRVVYSWNELFNTVVGNTVYIVTHQEGQALPVMNESILMISAQDIRTGRRYLKNLHTITIRRAE